jgi:hypothetical protein
MPASDWPVKLNATFGCWEWQAKRDRDGYGRAGLELAHRKVYQAEVGPIPDGTFLDHTCRVRACVRPSHLQPVTQRENERRKRWRNRSSQETCSKGHSLWEHGRRTEYGGKICLVCAPIGGR